MPINYFRNIAFSFLMFALSADLFAYSLNLSGTAPSQLRQTLQPIIGIITVEQTPPLAFLGYADNPRLSVGVKLNSLAIPEFRTTTWGFPSFWMKYSISPNLSIGGNISSYEWLDDNIQTAGSFLSTSWGTPQKSSNACFHIDHLKGPDDFHLTNVAFDLSRTIRYSQWLIAVSYSAHFVECDIHIADYSDPAQIYKTTKNLGYNFLRFGVFRYFG
ncbi:MAG TPA: hypothetical protein DHW42_01550, partial [Candidatus Marinimicrobia bacterium]|nr:hypothetical protein [Candidatus Neomarinimicrobiota bacterium]